MHKQTISTYFIKARVTVKQESTGGKALKTSWGSYKMIHTAMDNQVAKGRVGVFQANEGKE